MHYNHFTIDYIEAIKNHLSIQLRSDGKGVFFPEKITLENLTNLKISLDEIWKTAGDSIKIVKTRHDSSIQSGLFGLVNELENALKIGFLLGDRVVLIDYLYERILSKKDLSKVNIEHLGVISSSLVSALPLAKVGRIVLIPNPFRWNPETKQIINDIFKNLTVDFQTVELINMLSITKKCKLHPYTIAENKTRYHNIVDKQLNFVDAIGKDGSLYAYEGILGGLLTEKLLDNVEFKCALDIPLSEYHKIITASKDFYNQYLYNITTGGSLNSKVNLKRIKEKLEKEIEERNNKLPVVISKKISNITEISMMGAALIGVFVSSAPLTITAVLLTLSSKLFNLIKKEKGVEDPIISVFMQIHRR